MEDWNESTFDHVMPPNDSNYSFRIFLDYWKAVHRLCRLSEITV